MTAQDMSIFIATHSHGSVLPAYAQSLALLCGNLGSFRVSHSVMIVEDPFVDRGRDHAAAAFLESGMTHLLFIDADVQFEWSDVLRLIQCRKPLVAGAYRMKNDSGDFAVSFPMDAKQGCEWDAATGSIAVDGIGCGFMLIERDVFLAIEAGTPDLAYEVQDASGDPQKRHAFFDQGRDGVHRVGEDIAFCRRWRACGGKVWLCPDLCLTHWGRAPYRGALSDQIQIVDEPVAAE